MSDYRYVFAVCLLGIVTSAGADATLTFRSGNAATANTVSVSHGKVLMTTDSRHSGASIFDQSANRMTMIDHQRRGYRTMDEQAMDTQVERMQGMQTQLMEQMRARMQAMPPEQRRQAEQYLAQMGGAGAAGQALSEPPLSIHDTSRTDTVAGIPCKVYETRQQGRVMGEACVASSEDLGLSRSDYSALRAMFAFMKKFSDRASSAMGATDPGMGADLMSRVDGLPVRMQDTAGNTFMELVSLSGDAVSPAKFQVPAGYNKFQAGGR